MRTRTENVQEARRLRAAGLKLREIGDRMGVSLKTVHTWLADPDLSRQKARRKNYEGTCEVCGASTNGAGGYGTAPSRCRLHVGYLEADRRKALELYVEGYSGYEVEEITGMDATTVNGLARAAGVNRTKAEALRLAVERGRHVGPRKRVTA